MTKTAVGQFDFDDGGTYCGGSEGSKAHGFGICSGPGGQGEFCGAWQSGFELSGIYTWPNGNDYTGQWMQGKRHGLGVERRGHWIYRGEWTQGFMGRYGVRQSTLSGAKYEGTWTAGLHDGYGLETYSDGGTYQGQWMKGMRHGYGVRKSAIFSKAAFCPSTKVKRSSLTSVRSEVDLSEQANSEYPSPASYIGFFLKGRNREKANEQNILFFSRHRFVGGNDQDGRCITAIAVDDGNCLKKDSNSHCTEEEGTLTEIYIGEWRNDKRSGFGVCERSDGLRYEGEWLENCKAGYGVTLFSDGSKEEGKYKNNVLMKPARKMLLLLATKLREQIDMAVTGAQKAAQIALQKSDIANSRMESARSKAELAVEAVDKARFDSDKAKQQASEIIQCEPRAGQLQITTRLSIPRYNMVDINSAQHQLGIDQILPGIKKNDLVHLDHHELQSKTSYNESNQKKSQRIHPFLITEACNENVPDQQRATANTQKDYAPEVNEMLEKGLVGHECTVERRSSRQMQVNRSGSQSMLLKSHASEDSNDVDHLAEIEDIFSYLAEEETDTEEPFSKTTSESPKVSKIQQLFHGPSLRHRRDVTCPNLVIVSQDCERENNPAPLKRRSTLPCILKYDSIVHVADRGTDAAFTATSNNARLPSKSKVIETIVIDNGVRKYLAEEDVSKKVPSDPAEEVLEPPKDLPKRYRFESTKKSKKKNELGSLPNVSSFRRLDGRAIPRHEAELLCQKKRDELQQIKDIENEFKKRALVLKIGDIKEWCKSRVLAILLVAVNLVLIVSFSKLLS